MDRSSRRNGIVWAWGVTGALLLFIYLPRSCNSDALRGLHEGPAAARSGVARASRALGPQRSVVPASCSFAPPPVPLLEADSSAGRAEVPDEEPRPVAEPKRHVPARLPTPAPDAQQIQTLGNGVGDRGGACSRSDPVGSRSSESDLDPPRFSSFVFEGNAGSRKRPALRFDVPRVRRVPSIDATVNDAASDTAPTDAVSDMPSADELPGDMQQLTDRPETERIRRLPSLDGMPQASPASSSGGPFESEQGSDPDKSNERWTPVSVPSAGLDAAGSAAARDTTFAVIARRVMVLSHEAEDLASRGAYYAARAKMIKSLRIITQALDSQKTGKHHSEALGRAKQAFREVGDFAPRGSLLEAELDVARVISAHRTKVFQDVNVEHLTPLAVRQKYLEYAQRQFAEACDGLPIGSYALYGVGRVYAVMARADIDKQMLCLPKALTLHQAALLVDSNNVQAANELGVLLAEFGQLKDARRALRHALSIESRPEIWMNLAVVHQQLGESELALEARENGTLMASRQADQEQRNGDAGIKWVDPKTFSETRFWHLR
ncbi:MAG: hypothetical protein ACODAD_10520 [Planctomycetota bacterium]